MKGELYQSDLDFIEKAKKAFENDHRLFTYTSKEDDLIALRYGMDHDCIKLLTLGDEKAFFHNIMEKCPVETVKKEESKIDAEKRVFLSNLKRHTNNNSSFTAARVYETTKTFLEKHDSIPNTVILGVNQCLNQYEEFTKHKSTSAMYMGMHVLQSAETNYVDVALATDTSQ